MRYHLAAPEAYLQAGKIIYLPHQAFSNFPFQIEMLFTMAMSLQGTESAKLVHLTFLESSAVLTALIAFLLIRLSVKKSWRALKMYGVEFAYFAGLGFALIPCATILACWAFVDLAVCAYFLAFFYLMILAFVSGERPPAWLAGLMMGGCIATKYSMLPLTMAMLALAWLTAWAVPLISGVLLMRRVKKAGDEFGPPESYFLLPPIGASYLIRTAMVGLLVAAPWFVKSAAWTGNPIYPLAYGVFGGKDWSAANAQFYTAKAAEKGMHLDLANGIITRMIELIISPVATSLFPEKFEGHYLGAIPLMGLALATGGILLFAVGLMKDRDEGRSRPVAGDPSREAARWCVRAAAAFWMGGTIVGSWLFWFLTYQSNRFLLPTIALVLAAGAWGTMLLHLRGSSSAARAVRVSFIGGLIYALIYSGASIVGSQPRSASILGREWMMGGTRLGMPLACALGFESRESYLKRRLGYYAAARWLRERTSPQEKALLIGEHRTLYFGKDIIASDWFDTPQPLDLIRRTKDNNELLDTLKSDGVKFILFNRGELKLYADRYLRPRISPMEFARFDALIGFRNFPPDSRLRPVYRDESGSIEIFEIGP
ncbi:hypothetical protein HY256_10730 [Candidatus Sumerlaeota bacterium]|nr:hypothetical protein [Candidatus Sumerlaeota bacterium]